MIVEIPDEPAHIRAWWGNFMSLAKWYNWQRDDDKHGKEVADVWREEWYKARETFLTCIEAPEADITEAPCVCVELNAEWLNVLGTLAAFGLRSCAWCGDASDKERGVNGIADILELMSVGNCGKRLKSLVLGPNGELVATWEEGGEETAETIGNFISSQNVPQELLEDNSSQYTCFAITELIDHLVELYLWYVDTAEDEATAGFEIAQFLVNVTNKFLTLGLDVGGIESSIENAQAFAEANFEDLRDSVNDPDWQERVRCALFCVLSGNDFVLTEEIFNAWRDTELHFDTPPLVWQTDIDTWVERNMNFNYIAHRFVMSLADETEENECFDCDCDGMWSHTWEGSALNNWSKSVGSYQSGDGGYLLSGATYPLGNQTGKPKWHWLECKIAIPALSVISQIKFYTSVHTLDYQTTSEDHTVGVLPYSEIHWDRNESYYPDRTRGIPEQAGTYIGWQIFCGSSILPNNNAGIVKVTKIVISGLGTDPWA